MIVATVGHVDHGKTTLVRALTGIDTDRLPEEKARGMSIDLGFAYRRLPDGRLIAFVDVPGHQRFARNMLAGVCAIDFALIVIAADDGVMPQTREHAGILDLLGVQRGAVVITKTDRVPRARADEVAREVRSLLAGTALARAPLLRAAPPSGVGVADVLRCIESAAHDLIAPQDAPPKVPTSLDAPGPLARLAIDRAFTVAGSGTVVTGTVVDGSIRPGDELVVSPTGTTVRVRRIRMHDSDAVEVHAGMRCALNLVGVDVQVVQRGQWLLEPSLHRPTRDLDVRLRVLRGAEGGVVHRRSLQVHLGTACVTAQVLLPRDAGSTFGSALHARLRLEQPIGALRGDRFILRDSAGHRTLGGGVLLDPFAAVAPPAHRLAPEARGAREARLRALAQPSPQAALDGLVGAAPGVVELDWLAPAFKLSRAQALQLVAESGLICIGRERSLVMQRQRLAEWTGNAVVALAHHHRTDPRSKGLGEAAMAGALGQGIPREAMPTLLDALVDQGRVLRRGGHYRLADHVVALPAAERALWKRVRPRLAGSRGAPARASELAARLMVDEAALLDLLHHKVQEGELLAVGEGRFALRETIAAAGALALRLAEAQADRSFSAAQFRDALGTGRAAAIAILECLDSQRITRRRGERRRMTGLAPASLDVAAAAQNRRRESWRYRHRFAPREPMT